MQYNCPRVQISAVSLSKFGTCVQSVNGELGGKKPKSFFFPASSLFDKIVRQQKEKKKRMQSVVLVFCSFLSRVRNESGMEKKKS